MIELKDKNSCCGCSACMQRCPKHCISMQEDEEGFLYPVVDKKLCIDCNLCVKVCPVINKSDTIKPLEVFAAENTDEQKRMASSSGGLFIVMAERVISDNGAVFGCRFDNNWETYQCMAESEEELQPLMRSKYLQSRVGNTFKEAEKLLKQGRKVLYVGTPCQVAGLNLFLHKEYDNLLCVDFICHGVPSPGVWRIFLNGLFKSDSLNKIITNINFRSKEHFGWKKFGFVIKGKTAGSSTELDFVSSIATDNPFMKGFLSNVYLRPSCYHCPVKGGRSHSDLTIADYWCIDRVLPEVKDDDKGISLLFVNTKKGKCFVDGLAGVKRWDAPFEKTIANNPSYYKPPYEPKRRKIFFHELEKHHDFEKALQKFYHQTFMQSTKKLIKKILKKL